MERPLADIEEQGPQWLEWCGALYESYAADHEESASYARTAHSLVEEIEYGVYEETEDEY